MERKLWTLVLLLALLNPQMYFFQDWFKGNGNQGCNYMQISITQSPMRVLENYSSQDIIKTNPEHPVGKGVPLFHQWTPHFH